ncbi:hypothetical protein LXL04_038073 [Taraxacum kok-saghyz]
MSKSILVVKQPTVNLVYLVALLCLSCLWDCERVSRLQLEAWIYVWILLAPDFSTRGASGSKKGAVVDSQLPLLYRSLLAALCKAALYGIVTGLISVFASSKLKFHFVDSVISSTEEFRKQCKEENPENKSVAAASDPPFLPHVTELKSLVVKAGGVKWKSLSESEKTPFQAKADKRKKQYEKDMDTYNNKPVKSLFKTPLFIFTTILKFFV